MVKNKTESWIVRRGRLLDDYVTADGNTVMLYKIPGTFVTIFPGGSFEYHQCDDNWRNEIAWRYGEHTKAA